jgi:hypothetical protein
MVLDVRARQHHVWLPAGTAFTLDKARLQLRRQLVKRRRQGNVRRTETNTQHVE